MIVTNDGKRVCADLPVGIQIISPCLKDATPTHVAGLLPEAIGGFMHPPRR
jgi:Asp-tRNA(Asn)/Glu-tRNA(Gln) amidotransferase A subunit family amidase